MKKRTGLTILIPANLLALVPLLGSHTSSTSVAESFCDSSYRAIATTVVVMDMSQQNASTGSSGQAIFEQIA
jgi:hypothetical protein